jgi:hypothetical protein
MKKIIMSFLLTFSLTSVAFWGNNNAGSGWNDNGFFSYNPYDYWDPRWYPKEMGNMLDEFENNGWGENSNQNSYGYNNYPSQYLNNYKNSGTGWGNQRKFAPIFPTQNQNENFKR